MKNLILDLQTIILRTMALALVCLTVNISQADELPSHYPKAFMWSGTIDKITNRSIIIGDREFNINQNLSVHLLKSYTTSIRDLKIGMTVGCEVSDANELNAVWEFPDSLSSASGPWAGNLFNMQQ